jgi:hypothetical protein
MTFTDQQLKNWASYEEVRLSGEINMFDSRAAVAAGLSRDEHLFCMTNYAALKAAHEAKANT